jgi:putative nucleotidyltransferase with HDIG domain
MHEELAAYGKNVIPPEELTRILILVQDEVPRLWATGAWDKLRHALTQISSFVKFYELPVRSELSLAERRKPGLTKALLMGANNLPISQATPLIRSLVGAIDSRDRYMRGHSDTVARLVVQIAKKMNWSGEDLDMLEIAALLHDVGKIAIPENVLTKLDPLTPDEWKTIQMHPYHGAKIVKSLDTLSRIIPWVYHHQERWDGAGYPDGLAKETIPAAARIIGVGEAYTVMITDQPKRPALSIEQAISEIQKGAGTQFDPEVADAFSEAVSTSTSAES